MKKARRIWAMVCLGVLTGCATAPVEDHFEKDPDYLYALGHQQMQQGQYRQAINTFESLHSQYPFSKDAQKGMVDLIYVYYQDNQPDMALALAQQFTSNFPTSDQIGYVYYMKGVVNFENGRGFLQRHLKYDMDQHDPSAYKTAFNQFKKAIKADPNANYVDDAHLRMIYLYNTIAQYYYNIAKFYYDRQAYVAAADRARQVVLHYPKSSVRQQALQLLANAYQQLGLPAFADNVNTVLKLNLPEEKPSQSSSEVNS